MASGKLSSNTSNSKHFDLDELKTIGMQCGRRLPPASAVQAMFLYEMQRQTEAERLFQGAMFRLARESDLLSGLGGQLTNLEEQVKDLKRQQGQSDVAAKVQIGKVRLDAFQVNLNQCVAGLNELREKVQVVDKGSTTLEERAVTTSPFKDAYADTALWCDIKELNTNIDVLFDERDAMVKCLDDLNDRQKEQTNKQEAFNQEVMGRLSQLEGLLQRTKLNSEPSGRLHDLKSLFNLSENYKPSPDTNEFVPGKPRTS